MVIIVIGSSKEAISTLVKDLNTHFAIKELGDLHFFLGIEVKKLCIGASRKSWYVRLQTISYTIVSVRKNICTRGWCFGSR
jgi:hypothetical protein